MKKKMKFYKTPLEYELLVAKVKKHPSLLQIFRQKKDITPLIKQDILLRTCGEIENFVTLFITGAQGSFKSSLGITIAEENDPTGFTADRICFTYREFEDKVRNSKPKEWIMLDEEVFQHGVGSGRIIDSIQTFIETLRQRQNSMIIISPEGKYFPEGIFTYVLETIDKSIIGVCSENQKPHEIRTCMCKPHTDIEATIRAAVKKENTYIGFYITKIRWNNLIWREYQKKKNKFLKAVTTQHFVKIDYENIAKKILTESETERYKTSKQLKLLLEKKYPNLAVGEKELIIEEIQLRRRKKEEKEIKNGKRKKC